MARCFAAGLGYCYGRSTCYPRLLIYMVSNVTAGASACLSGVIMPVYSVASLSGDDFSNALSLSTVAGA